MDSPKARDPSEGRLSSRLVATMRASTGSRSLTMMESETGRASLNQSLWDIASRYWVTWQELGSWARLESKLDRQVQVEDKVWARGHQARSTTRRKRLRAVRALQDPGTIQIRAWFISETASAIQRVNNRLVRGMHSIFLHQIIQICSMVPTSEARSRCKPCLLQSWPRRMLWTPRYQSINRITVGQQAQVSGQASWLGTATPIRNRV